MNLTLLGIECTTDLKIILNLGHTVINLIQFGIPIILIILGSIDMGKAVIQQDDKKIKESQSLFIKRLIAAVLVFLVGTIVNVLVGVLPEDVTGTKEWQSCWNGRDS